MNLYIHFPFCRRKCSYCALYSRVGSSADARRQYIESIRAALGSLRAEQRTTIYFGGGTPSFFGAKRIANIFDELKGLGRVRRDSEVTVECNPDSMKLQDLKMLRKEGVNRLSIGMQSANNEILKMIGRRHNFKQVEMAVRNARKAGFENISLDLVREKDQYLMGWSDVQGADKQVALVADVYTANADNNPDKSILFEAVGEADEIYVVVEIGGYLYLTRGSVLSYREFIQPIDQPRLTDEEWQEQLEKNARKGVPEWMKRIIVPLNKLPEANEEFFYSSGC